MCEWAEDETSATGRVEVYPGQADRLRLGRERIVDGLRGQLLEPGERLLQASRMLQKLGLLIGFATVMGGASLLITIWVQAVSWVLALRGRSLKTGLVEVFKSVVPPAKRAALSNEFEQLADRILSVHESELDVLKAEFGKYQHGA